MYKKQKPIIGITMGDPAGVGPEVAVKALHSQLPSMPYHPLMIGDIEVYQKITKKLDIALGFQAIESLNDADFNTKNVNVLQSNPFSIKYELGKTSEECGEASFRAVEKAIELCQNNHIAAMVTAPINKKAWHLAGHKFDGHTGFIAKKTQTEDYRMMFISEKLNVVLTTTHIPLMQVRDNLNEQKVYKTICLGYQALKKMGVDNIRIAVCGLNPHAGENGIFGNEEKEIIEGAIKKAQSEGIQASGPYPSDTVFLKAINGEFELVVAQYHDQGLIPVKLVAFNSAVNLTVGLSIIRTSVDHGTAFDIAEKGIADFTNMIHAINCAVTLSGG